MRTRVFLMSICLCLVPASARAQALGSGTHEVRVSAMIDRTETQRESGGETELVSADARISFGHSLTDLLQAGITVLAGHTRAASGGSIVESSAVGTTLDVVANLPVEESAVLFAGVSLGGNFWIQGSNPEPPVNWILPRLSGGVRLLVGDSAAVVVGASWQRETNALGDRDLDAWGLSMDAGVSVFPGGHTR